MDRTKRQSSILLMMTFLILALSVGAASAATIVLQVGSPSMTVDGVTREIDPGLGTMPIIVSDRTFVPIRAIVENLGGTVGYIPAEQKVTIQLQSTSVELWIGKPTARINGQDTTLATIPFVSATNRTMLPLRFVIENLGGQVSYDAVSQRITITYGNEKATQVVTISGFAFSPASLNINRGDTVTWINQDSAPHDIVGDTFLSPTLLKGQSYSLTFNQAGTVQYHCGIHPSMRGEVIVK